METPVEYNAGKPEKGERVAFVVWNPDHDDICPAPHGMQCGMVQSCAQCKVGMARKEVVKLAAKALAEYDFRKSQGPVPVEPFDIDKYYRGAAEYVVKKLLEKGHGADTTH